MLLLINFNSPFGFFFFFLFCFFPLSGALDSYFTRWRRKKKRKKIIVIPACLSRVVTVERWLLRLFVVSAALSEEEEDEEEEEYGRRTPEGQDERAGENREENDGDDGLKKMALNQKEKLVNTARSGRICKGKQREQNEGLNNERKSEDTVKAAEPSHAG